MNIAITILFLAFGFHPSHSSARTGNAPDASAVDDWARRQDAKSVELTRDDKYRRCVSAGTLGVKMDAAICFADTDPKAS